MNKKPRKLAQLYHDLTMPINTIIGLARLIDTNSENIFVKNYANKIQKSCKTLITLLEDINETDSIFSQGIVLKNESFSIAELIENVCTICDYQANLKSQNFICDVSLKSEEYFIGDKKLITKILLNVLLNAIKYTPKEGTITFETSINKINKQQSEITFIIQDNGIGITPSFLNKIFEPYERENTENVLKNNGNGLGLAISKQIVDMLDGTIEVESSLNKGSKFTIKFILKNQKQKTENLISNIAVLTDNITQEKIKNSYSNSNIELYFDNNQFTFLEELSNLHFDVVLIDLELLKEHRKKFINSLRHACVYSHLILLIGCNDETYYRYNGISGIIKKPFFPSSLKDIINKSQNFSYLKKSILIVDDNIIIQESIKASLEKHFSTIDIASNGKECLKKLEKKKYDIILLDINMPALNGISAYKKMVSNKLIEIDKTLVIILSSTKLNKYHHSLGLKFQLNKNFKFSELKNILDDFYSVF